MTIGGIVVLMGFPVFMGFVFASEEADQKTAWLQFFAGIPIALLAWKLMAKIPSGDEWWKRVSGSALFFGPMILLLITGPMAPLGYFFGLCLVGSAYAWRLRSRSGHRPPSLTDDELKASLRQVGLRYLINLGLAGVASLAARSWYLLVAGGGLFAFVYLTIAMTLLRQGGKISRATHILVRLIILGLVIGVFLLLANQT
jgi:hypothetical protein